MEALYVRQTAVAHADQVSHLQPGEAANAALPPGMNPFTPGGPASGALEALNGEITRQAAMVALIDVFWLMFILTLAVAPLLLLMRKPKAQTSAGEVVVE